MLRSLIIRDYVIVDRLQLDFERGYTALTGETGAGKSILIDALARALGVRNDGPVVRPGADRADITAEFEIEAGADLAQWLADNELEAEEGRCLLRRVIEGSGRSRSFINGRPATLAQCRELGGRDLLGLVHRSIDSPGSSTWNSPPFCTVAHSRRS